MVMHLFKADERTRLETRMTVSSSGFYVPLAYAVAIGLSALIAAFGWVPLGIALTPFEALIRVGLRRRGGRSLPEDGAFLREQLGAIVHAAEPVR